MADAQPTPGIKIHREPIVYLLGRQQVEIGGGDLDDEGTAEFLKIADRVNQGALAADERLEIHHTKAAQERNGSAEGKLSAFAILNIAVQRIDESDQAAGGLRALIRRLWPCPGPAARPGRTGRRVVVIAWQAWVGCPARAPG